MALRRTIELDAERNNRKPSKSYKPSSMNCIRNMWYQMMGAEPDRAITNYTSVGIAWCGTDIHLRVQAAVMMMREFGYDCDYIDVAEYIKEHNLDYLDVVSKNGPETKLYHKTLHMSFMCDGIIRFDGQYYILEIKSEASFKNQHRDCVDPKHYNQGTAYSIALRLSGVVFLYVNRDIFEMKAFLFRPTNEQKENVVGLITECDGYVSRMICPPKPEDISRRICEYCAYKDRCKRE